MALGQAPPEASRRSFLGGLASLSALALAAPATALPGREERVLAFFNTHTSERLTLPYAADGAYLPESLARLDVFLRDHRTGEEHAIDPALFDLMYDLQRATSTSRPFQVISGYRCPSTNRKLRKRSRGVARKSLHMEGRAIDIRIPELKLADLKDAARDLRRGGVGFYPKRGFVHVDTGDVRFWQGGKAI